MNAKNAKKIKDMAAALQPQEIYSEWLHTFELTETFDQLLVHVSTESAGRKLAALMPDLKNPGRKASKKKAQGKITPDHQNMISQWYFVGKMILGLNSTVDDIVSRSQYRLELAEVILQSRGIVRASKPTAQWTHGIDLEKFVALLIRARTNISINLFDLQSSKLACECISRKYGEDRNLLIKALATKVDALTARTQNCASEFQQVLRELQSDPISRHTEWSPDLCEIDLDALAQSAVTESEAIVRKLEVLAKGQMLIAFDETQLALKDLKPYLEDDGEPEEK
jgi:hypothetical protein